MGQKNVFQVYSSGAAGASAREDQREATVLHGEELPGVANGQSKRWRLDQDQVSGGLVTGCRLCSVAQRPREIVTSELQ